MVEFNKDIFKIIYYYDIQLSLIDIWGYKKNNYDIVEVDNYFEFQYEVYFDNIYDKIYNSN